MIKAVIFDLDGTLLNTLGDLTNGVNHTMRAFGYPEVSMAEVCSFIGNGIGVLIARCLPGGAENTDYAAALDEFRRFYSANCAALTAPYPGIPELLRELKRRGIGMAIASNKNDLAVKRLNKKFFEGYISVAVGEREGIRRKPAPDAILFAAWELGAAPDECIYVGDSEVDIEAAKNSGIRSVIVDWGFRDRALLIRSGAETIISSPEELLNYLDQ